MKSTMMRGTSTDGLAATRVSLHGIRNCDTMKKARAWLDHAGIAYRFHDYKVDGIDADTIDRFSRQLGWERLLNRAGTTFRKLVPEADRAAIDAAHARALMLAHPSMIRRPVLEIDGHLLLGFDPKAYEQVFGPVA
jgi:arsenate reductase